MGSPTHTAGLVLPSRLTLRENCGRARLQACRELPLVRPALAAEALALRA